MTNGKVRVLVADDEPLARERLRTLLAPKRLEVVASAPMEPRPSGHPRWSRTVFLDVQMPGAGDSVIGPWPTRVPLIVFVTAFVTCAARVRRHALDYLLKPFRPPALPRRPAAPAASRASSNGDLERRSSSSCRT
jgi:DNA-binding LytR/AlgR family response regulator